MPDKPPPPPALPTVFAFTDHRAFLNRWLEVKQQISQGYTVSRFARMAGCSPSHVRNVLHGERDLLPPYVDGFARALRLEADDAEFFTLLVRYAQASTLSERAYLLQQIAGTLRFRDAHPLEGVQFLSLARLSHVAVYELSSLPAFREDPAWIAEVLDLSPAEASAALAELRAAGMLVPRADGTHRAAFPFNATANEVAAPALVLLHDRGMEVAVNAAAGSPEDRLYFTAVGGVASSLVPELRAAVDRFHARADSLMAEIQASDARDHAPDTVLLMAVQLVPVSRPLTGSASGC